MDELKPRVEAGVLVGQRRWNLRLKSGVDVKLPETILKPPSPSF